MARFTHIDGKLEVPTPNGNYDTDAMHALAAISQAISLKRIADALEEQQMNFGGRKVVMVMPMGRGD